MMVFIIGLLASWMINATMAIFGIHMNDVFVRTFFHIPLQGGNHSNSYMTSGSFQRFAIFYNVFVSRENPTIARDVIEEQMDQIGKSFLASPRFATTIYYSTIGRSLPQGFMDQVCSERNNLTCKHVRHYEVGYEEATLASLYVYCKHHPDERVVYIHSKGKNLCFNPIM